MIPIRIAGAAVALAIVAAVASLAGAGKAADQVIEMPDGLKYTDTKLGDGAIATAGNKVSVHYTGWLSKDGAKEPSSTARSTAGSRLTLPSARNKSSPVGTRGSPA